LTKRWNNWSPQENVRDLKDALVLRGWELDSDLKFVEHEGA